MLRLRLRLRLRLTKYVCSVSQTVNGLPILENTKYEVVTSLEGYTFQSTLIIRDSTNEDFGYYGCAITNSLGSVEASIYLEKQGIPSFYKYFKYFPNSCELS